jgi:hypothetical protein
MAFRREKSDFIGFWLQMGIVCPILRFAQNAGNELVYEKDGL